MATGALTAVLLCLAFVEPATSDLDGLVSPRPLPLLAVAVLQFALAVSRRDAWRCLLGAGCLIAAGMVGRPGGAPMPYRVPVGFHMVLLTCLALGSVFDDALGRWLRNLGMALAVLGCTVVMIGRSVGAGDESPALGSMDLPACGVPCPRGLRTAARAQAGGFRRGTGPRLLAGLVGLAGLSLSAAPRRGP